MMTDRIHRLRNESLKARPRLDPERAMLLTAFYRDLADPSDAVVVQRAKALQYILQNKVLWIGPEELIVGERGPEPAAVPTYPEICLHSLQDLHILDTREKVSYAVDEEMFREYRVEVIPFWQGRSNRELLMDAMSEEWKKAYKAGIFTEFQEQRAPGHTVLGERIYTEGLESFRERIAVRRGKLSTTDEDNKQALDQLEAMDIAASAMIAFAARYAIELASLAKSEFNPGRKQELMKMAEACRRVPAQAPRDFHEALQYYWFIHLGVITEVNPWDSFSPGRLDQHLWPFYQNGLNEGTLTKEEAIEYLQAFWIKFHNHPAPPKVGVTAQESNTYTDFALINLGGLTEEGEDAVNELSYILLDVIQEMRLLQPSSMVQLSVKNPNDFVLRAIEIIRTGFGQPSVFNAEALVAEMLRQGKQLHDARKGGASGCVETGAFGTEAYFLTGYFNLPKILELTLNGGRDARTGEQLGPGNGLVPHFKSFEELLQAFREQLDYFIQIKIEGNLKIERLVSTNIPVPFLSLFIDDCIENAIDYTAGGARYNTSYIQGVGLGSITDALTSIKYHVFDEKTISLDSFLDILRNDFSGMEAFRSRLLFNTPKYGNDDDYADAQAIAVFEAFFDAVNGKPNTRGGQHRINLLPTTCHVYFGSICAATADGRMAGQPLSEGISPVQGADKQGPTSVLKSAAKIDHLRTGGTLLNQKFHPDILKSEEDRQKLVALIRAYFSMMAHHIQFNVVDAATLREAQEKPELYSDLIVRVAGYSDYFNNLGKALQDEIIRRTAHGVDA